MPFPICPGGATTLHLFPYHLPVSMNRCEQYTNSMPSILRSSIAHFDWHSTRCTKNDASCSAYAARNQLRLAAIISLKMIQGLLVLTGGFHALIVDEMIAEKIGINILVTSCALYRKCHVLKEPLVLFHTIIEFLHLAYRNT